MEDPMAPARGIALGVFLSLPFWIALAVIVGMARS
jgi:hypothetical protein